MKTFPLLLATTLAAFTGIAAAEPAEVKIQQREVSYDDLDLDDQADARKLYRRIARAARNVCGTSDLMLSTAVNAETCTGDAIARAIADVNAPLLTEYFLARDGVPADASEVVAHTR